MGKSTFALSITVVTSIIFSTNNGVEGRIQQCSSDYECEKIAPDADSVGIHTACEDSEYGNDKSPKVCSVLFWANREPGSGEIARNPNPKRCKQWQSEEGDKACTRYKNSYGPFRGFINGVSYFKCYTQSTAYICRWRANYYVICSIQATDCPDTCPVIPPTGGGARK